MNNVGLYIHAPFCRYKCPYCDFYSVKPNDDTVRRYANSVISEIEKYASQTDKIVDTVYFGGGTPTLMGKEIARILEAISKNFKTDLKEVTVEANPKAELYPLLLFYKESGVNRLSFGAQSANQNELKKLARTHTADDITRAVEDSVRAGISNISLDLMIGISGQTPQSLDRTIEFYTDLPITHISGYMLRIEEGTKYAEIQSKLNLPSDDATADLYEQMISRLSSKGFLQYEVSNFAKSGFNSLHNTKYWTLDEYIGIGASAHSFFEGKRFFYPPSIDEFIISPKTVFDCNGGSDFERVMLGLRLAEGISLDNITKKSQALIMENCNKIPSEYIILANNSLKLTQKGFLISNYIIANITEGIS